MTIGAENSTVHDMQPVPCEEVVFARRGLFGLAAAGALVLIVSGCGSEGIPSNHGVSSAEERAARREREAAGSLEQYQADQEPMKVELDRAKAVDRLAFKNGGIVDTIFDDLAGADSRLDYEDSARWRLSNSAANDGRGYRRTAVSASFGLGVMTIEKQVYDAESDEVIRIRALCSLPDFTNTPSGVNTKPEIIKWAKGEGSRRMHVVNLSCRLTPVDRDGQLENSAAESGAVGINYNGTELRGLSVASSFGGFDETLRTISNRWQVVADVNP